VLTVLYSQLMIHKLTRAEVWIINHVVCVGIYIPVDPPLVLIGLVGVECWNVGISRVASSSKTLVNVNLLYSTFAMVGRLKRTQQVVQGFIKTHSLRTSRDSKICGTSRGWRNNSEYGEDNNDGCRGVCGTKTPCQTKQLDHAAPRTMTLDVST